MHAKRNILPGFADQRLRSGIPRGRLNNSIPSPLRTTKYSFISPFLCFIINHPTKKHVGAEHQHPLPPLFFLQTDLLAFTDDTSGTTTTIIIIITYITAAIRIVCIIIIITTDGDRWRSVVDFLRRCVQVNFERPFLPGRVRRAGPVVLLRQLLALVGR